MNKRLCLAGLSLLFLCGLAHAGPEHHKIKSPDGECAAYSGAIAALPETDFKFLEEAVAVFRDKKYDALPALLDGKAQLIRRFGFSVSSRGGNLRLVLDPRQIDRGFNIHVGETILPEYMGRGKVHHHEQVLGEFGHFAPTVPKEALILNRKICDGQEECDIVPIFNGVEKLIDGLLYCSKYRNKVFVFTDGILLVDMQDVPGAGLPVGEALFFSHAATGHKLAALISFQ